MKYELKGFLNFNLLEICKFVQRCSMRKGVLKKFAKFTRKRPWQNLFLSKVDSKKMLRHRSLPVDFAKVSRELFYRAPSSDYICTS